MIVADVMTPDPIAICSGDPRGGASRAMDRADAGSSVRDTMHAQVVSESPGDQVVMAAVELSGRGIGCLPEIDEGELVGILTDIDLLAAYWPGSSSTATSDVRSGSGARPTRRCPS